MYRRCIFLFIHVVNTGETLWSISRQYGVRLDSIIQLNQIKNPSCIIKGQSLLIPSNEQTISTHFAYKQRTPTPRKRFGTIEVNAFIEASENSDQTRLIHEYSPYITYLSIFSHTVTREGTLLEINDRQLISSAIQNNTAPLMVVSNYVNGKFDSDVVHCILSDKNIQDKLIDNIIYTIKEKKYYGVNVDFEHILPDDRKPLNSFLTHFKSKLKKYGILLTTSVLPKYSDEHTSPRYSAYDYFTHGITADRVILMTYEWGWFGGPPMPVAPCNQLKNVLDFVNTSIPKHKAMMGIPLYSYDWELPYIKENVIANTLTPHHALELAQKQKTVIHYDTIAQVPYFNYLDSTGKQHIVWFEDARSIKAKFELVHKYGLGGISYWSIGRQFPQNWLLLHHLFEIKKVL